MRAIPLGRQCGREERGDEGEGSGLEFGVGGGMEEQKVSHINQAPKTPFSVCPQCHPSCRGTHSFLYCLFLIAAAGKSGNFSSQVSQSWGKWTTVVKETEAATTTTIKSDVLSLRPLTKTFFLGPLHVHTEMGKRCYSSSFLFWGGAGMSAAAHNCAFSCREPCC